MYLVAMKMENDFRIGLSLQNEKSPGLAKLIEYTNANFDKITGDVFYNQSLLYFMAQYTVKTRRNFLSKDKEIMVVNKSYENLENHKKIGLMSILNIISNGGMFKGINARPYLQDREDELQQLGFYNLLRIAKRLLVPRQAENVADTLLKMISRETFNLASEEKIVNKTKAFVVFAKLEWEFPFTIFHTQLINLLRDIRTQAENFDQSCILNIMEGLVYLEDAMRHETLKEVLDIVSATIQHQPENVRIEFIIKLITFLSKMNNEQAITVEHIDTMSEFILNSLKKEESEGRSRNLYKLFSIFTLFRKQRYFDRKDTIEQFSKIYEPKLKIQNSSELLKDYKFVVLRNLGDEYFNNIAEKVTKDIRDEFYEDINEKNIGKSLMILSKASLYSPKSDITKEIAKATIERIAEAKMELGSFSAIIESYVKYIQFELVTSIRIQVSETLLAKLNEYDFTTNSQLNFVLFLSEIVIPKDREDLKAKVVEVTNTISQSPQFKKYLLQKMRTFVRINTNHISNASVFKFTQLIRENVKSQEFIAANDRLLTRLVEIAFNLIYNLERENDLTLSLVALCDVIDNIHKTHPNLPISYPYARVPTLVKGFNRAEIQLELLNHLGMAYLKSLPETKDINGDVILILEKILKSSLPKEEINELVQHVLKNEENMTRVYDKLGNKNSFFRFLSAVNMKSNSLVTHDFMKNLRKKHMVYIANSPSDIQKVNGLFSMTNLISEHLNYEEEINEYEKLIRESFQSISLVKLIRGVQNIHQFRNRFIRKIFAEISYKFDADGVRDKSTLLRVIDKFTQVGWTNINFYNKFFDEYSRLFERLTSREHVEVVSYFARVELSQEDLIKAAVSKMQLNYMHENDKITMFNCLIKLGFWTPEWQELFLEKLIQEIDFNSIHYRMSFRSKLQMLASLSKLSDWPKNLNEIVRIIINQQSTTFIKNINKGAKYTLNKDQIGRFAGYNEVDIKIIRRSSLYPLFEDELKTNLDSLYDQVVLKESRLKTIKIIKESLAAMGHEAQFMPTDTLCDFFIPKTNTAVIVPANNVISLADRSNLNATGNYFVAKLKEQGHQPVVVLFGREHFDYLRESPQKFIQLLESAGIPRQTKEVKYELIEEVRKTLLIKKGAKEDEGEQEK